MMSFAGPHLALPKPGTISRPIRISHCRTPSLSSTSSTAVSSTEDELCTDSTSICASPLDKDLSETNAESEIDIDLSTCEPKTPMPLMTPTTPTDRFTKLSVSMRRAKGDAFVHRRPNSIHAHRREGVIASERTPRLAGISGFPHGALRERGSRFEVKGGEVAAHLETKQFGDRAEGTPVSSLSTESRQPTTHEAVPIPKVELALTARCPHNKSYPSPRHQPYSFRQSVNSEHKEGTLARHVLRVDSLPPTLKNKLQGEPAQQWLLVGPDVAQHLHMGGSVLVRDYAGNVIGWMS
ncbi:hypothetical protein NCC49_005025 [Naganishia albida]|nr:hypothetical protein NCC49_005025 [Naganishia albida]